MAESALSLVERLRAALDRAEEIARSAALRSPAPWRLDGDPWAWASAGQGLVDAKGDGVAVAIGSYVADHVMANDPVVVLRTVAAHRKILDRHPVVPGTRVADLERVPICERCYEEAPCPDVAAVASIYFPEAPDA